MNKKEKVYIWFGGAMLLVLSVTAIVISNYNSSQLRGAYQYIDRSIANFAALNTQLNIMKNGLKSLPKLVERVDDRTDQVLTALSENAKGTKKSADKNKRYSVIITKGNLYLRRMNKGPFDLVKKFFIGTGPNINTNGVVRSNGTRNIKSSTGPLSTISEFYKSKNILRDMGDESPAFNINGMFVGGNHGFSNVYTITSANHKIENSQIGSKWFDSTGNVFLLVAVIDQNQLKFVADNIGGIELWRVPGALAGKVLTAKNSRKLTFSKVKRGQLYPSIQNYKLSIISDDGELPINNGIYNTNTLKVLESYEVVNLSSALEQIKSGSRRNLSSQVIVNITRSFNDAELSTRHVSLTNLQKYRQGFWGGLQSLRPHLDVNDRLMLFVPGTHDASNGIDVTNSFNRRIIDRRTWGDISNPPNQAIFLVEQNNKPRFGYIVGIDTTLGLGVPTKRSKSTNIAFEYSARGKLYLRAEDEKSGKISQAGEYRELLIYEGIFSTNDVSSHFYNSNYRLGDELIVVAGTTKANETGWIKVPNTEIGKKIAIRKISGPGSSVLSSIVNQNGILIRSGDFGGKFTLTVK